MVLQARAADQVLDSEREPGAASMRAIQDVGRERSITSAPARAARETDDPPLRPRPGLADLERLLAAVRQRGPSRAPQDHRRSEPLPAALDGAAYRVIQEALTNALKHSGAAPTDVTVRSRPKAFTLTSSTRGLASPRPDRRSRAGRDARARRAPRRAAARRARRGRIGIRGVRVLPYAPAPRVDSEHVHA
jgi:hypothetical protein